MVYLPENLQKSVALITAKTAAGGNQLLAGFVFFVSIPFITDPEKVFIYMVTTQGVLNTVRENAVDDFVYVRANTRTGKAGVARVPHDQWLTHPTNPTAGVAVLPWAPDRRQFDFSTVHLRQFASAAQSPPAVGAAVALAEVVVNPANAMRNLPVVRGGRLAARPKKTIALEDGVQMRASVLEMQSSSWLAGGAVFGMHTVGKKEAVCLLGVMQGTWILPPYQLQPDKIFAADNQAPMHAMQAGLALMIDAQTVRETIEHPDLVAARLARDVRKER